jgi:D-alanyl-D-alanine dipeptidase
MITDETIIPYLAIPVNAGQVKGWKDIPIRDKGRADPLVPLGPLSREAGTLMTSSVYFGEHDTSPYARSENKLKGSLLTLFVRQSVARRLLFAEQLLPAGYHLIVFDAYRPYGVQKSLYDFYRQQLKRSYPGMSDEALELETQKYVSLPSQDPARPSPHNTGGAVDVAIIKTGAAHRKSKMLNFGTAFDHGGERAALAYYESKIAMGEVLAGEDVQACNNRRLLFAVMTKAGFQPYFAEWWHFNALESQMGAAAAGLDYATFGAINPIESNMAHENTRLVIHRAKGVGSDGDWPTEIIAPSEE